VSEAFYPGYNLSENYISDLGVGPSSLIFNISVFLLGALMVGGAFLLQRGFHDRIFTVFLILDAVGAMGVGVFPENLEPMHSLSAVLIFLFGGVSALYSFRLVKQPFTLISIILGVWSLVASGLFAMEQYLGLGVGGMERMIVYPVLMWIFGFSGYLLACSEQS